MPIIGCAFSAQIRFVQVGDIIITCLRLLQNSQNIIVTLNLYKKTDSALACRKPWIDRDNPGGVGDYETLPNILVETPQLACPQPIAIEVATISGTPTLPTQGVFETYGFHIFYIAYIYITKRVHF